MKNKKQLVVLATLILILVLMIGGISYAAFQFVGHGNKINSITTGAITMSYIESDNDINLQGALPTTDETGKKRLNEGEYFDFTVKSSIAGNTDINYEIAAKEEADNTFSGSNVKYYLTSLDSDGNETEVMAPRTYYEEKKANIYTGRPTKMMSLFVGNLNQQGTTSIRYRLRIWVDEAYNPQNDNEGLVYKVKINVYGEGSNNIALLEDQHCYNYGITKLSDCMLVMNNHEKTVAEAITAIDSKGTPDFSKTTSNDGEKDGLYMTEDDEGESYYYRGAVKNNYVSFAGFIWRIIRRNGDGSVRMIYSGKTTSDTGDDTTIGKGQFNSKTWDPTYVGYKYNEDFSLHEDNGIVSSFRFDKATKYAYGTGYSFNESTKKFAVTGNIKYLSWSDNHEEIVNNQLYSCVHANCNILYKVTGYGDETHMLAKVISYSSNSLTGAQTNAVDSPIKTKLDDWYQANLTNYSSYIADETFCNDRSIVSGTGYRIDTDTEYATYDRLKNKKMPSLKCSQENDKFKVSNANAKLDNPIGLILADEVALAGASLTATTRNTNYYLYMSQSMWTFSPSSFTSGNTNAGVFTTFYGMLTSGLTLNSQLVIRPVINLKADTLITKGDGSQLNPFVLSVQPDNSL